MREQFFIQLIISIFLCQIQAFEEMFGMTERDLEIRKQSLSYLDEYALNLDEGNLSDEQILADLNVDLHDESSINMESELITDHDIDTDDLNELKEVFHETSRDDPGSITQDEIKLKDEVEEPISKLLPPPRIPKLKKQKEEKLILPKIQDSILDTTLKTSAFKVTQRPEKLPPICEEDIGLQHVEYKNLTTNQTQFLLDSLQNYSSYLTNEKLMQLVKVQEQENPDWNIQVLDSNDNKWGQNYSITNDVDILIGVYEKLYPSKLLNVLKPDTALQQIIKDCKQLIQNSQNFQFVDEKIIIDFIQVFSQLLIQPTKNATDLTITNCTQKFHYYLEILQMVYKMSQKIYTRKFYFQQIRLIHYITTTLQVTCEITSETKQYYITFAKNVIDDITFRQYPREPTFLQPNCLKPGCENIIANLQNLIQCSKKVIQQDFVTQIQEQDMIGQMETAFQNIIKIVDPQKSMTNKIFIQQLNQLKLIDARLDFFSIESNLTDQINLGVMIGLFSEEFVEFHQSWNLCYESNDIEHYYKEKDHTVLVNDFYIVESNLIRSIYYKEQTEIKIYMKDIIKQLNHINNTIFIYYNETNKISKSDDYKHFSKEVQDIFHLLNFYQTQYSQFCVIQSIPKENTNNGVSIAPDDLNFPLKLDDLGVIKKDQKQTDNLDPLGDFASSFQMPNIEEPNSLNLNYPKFNLKKKFRPLDSLSITSSSFEICKTFKIQIDNIVKESMKLKADRVSKLYQRYLHNNLLIIFETLYFSDCTLFNLLDELYNKTVTESQRDIFINGVFNMLFIKDDNRNQTKIPIKIASESILKICNIYMKDENNKTLPEYEFFFEQIEMLFDYAKNTQQYSFKQRTIDIIFFIDKVYSRTFLLQFQRNFLRVNTRYPVQSCFNRFFQLKSIFNNQSQLLIQSNLNSVQIVLQYRVFQSFYKIIEKQYEILYLQIDHEDNILKNIHEINHDLYNVSSNNMNTSTIQEYRKRIQKDQDQQIPQYECLVIAELALEMVMNLTYIGQSQQFDHESILQMLKIKYNIIQILPDMETRQVPDYVNGEKTKLQRITRRLIKIFDILENLAKENKIDSIEEIKGLVRFLALHYGFELTDELGQVYIDTVDWYGEGSAFAKQQAKLQEGQENDDSDEKPKESDKDVEKKKYKFRFLRKQ